MHNPQKSRRREKRHSIPFFCKLKRLIKQDDFFNNKEKNLYESELAALDLPQLCGPSGTTAKRLALANQAGLDQDEMELFHFFIAMFNVAIGAHTIDESCIIAQGKPFNHYIRGDYNSIFPDTVKTKANFADFYKKILDFIRNIRVDIKITKQPFCIEI